MAALKPMFVTMLALAISTNAQIRDDATNAKPLTSASRSTIVRGWQMGYILPSLIRVALTNHLPVGIVLEGNSLCRDSVPGSSGDISIEAIIDQVQSRDSDYTAELRNHVLYVHPKVMKASTIHALGLRIPTFTSGSTNVSEIGISLWMYIRGVLVPQEPSMFAGPLQRNAEILPTFTVSNSSVHDILDRVITLGQGGAWIMYQVPADWQSNPKTKPYEILSYAGDQRPAEGVTCPEDK